MPIKILLPALSPTMKTGNLVRWLKQEQDIIYPGDVIAEVETDKATMEIEAVDEGILAKIIIPEGTNNVEVNSVIAILLEENEKNFDLEHFINTENFKTSDLIVNVEQNETSTTINTEELYKTNINSTKQLFVSPLARKIATIEGIDLTKILGSGPEGRIIKSDIEKVLTNEVNTKTTNQNNTEHPSYTPHNNIKKIVARRLQESKQKIPHFYLSIECCVDKLLTIREEINKVLASKNNKISINDFIVLATANCLHDMPEVNVSWSEEGMQQHKNIDISIAVDTKHGLMTPILYNADKKDILTISNEIKLLVGKAKDNKLKLHEFQGGGFSISNLGMYGIKSFSAIINPPQSAILAVGMVDKKIVLVDKEVTEISILTLNLSCDHRVIDGVVAAKFLVNLKKYLESPALMLL